MPQVMRSTSEGRFQQLSGAAATRPQRVTILPPREARLAGVERNGPGGALPPAGREAL
ncbi:MAG: hypothetical protein NTY38_04290 [Acidobacteria bacterium]|nr:hypothetical protein [Acidobacteriota bacterium]